MAETIEDKVDDLTIQVSRLTDKFDWHMNQLTEVLSNHEKKINGYNGTPGMDRRLDRLEIYEAGRTKHLMALYPAALLGAIGWLWSHLFPGK